jgi:hypothetical protein
VVSWRVFDESHFVGRLGGFIGSLPLGGGGEFARWSGLAFFQEAVGAENDAVGVPKPDEPETADGFELEESVAKGVDLLFVLREAMVAGVIEELGELGELVRMKSRRFGEKFFRRAIRSVSKQVNAAGWTGLLEECFHGDY